MSNPNAATTNNSNKSGNVRTHDAFSGVITLALVFIVFYAILFFILHNILNHFNFVLSTEYSFFQLSKYIIFNYNDFIHNFINFSISLKLNFVVRIIVPLPLAAYFAWQVAKDQIKPVKTELLEQGIEVIKDPKIFYKLLKRKLAKATGVRFHNTLQLEQKRESEHIWIGGSTGAGKTQLLSHFIDSILERVKQRKAKLILFCIKGDYVAQLIPPTIQECNRIKHFLVNPTDARSIKWNIAADLAGNEIACHTFASAFIPESKNGNPYFINAPREVLTGALMYLHATHGVKWGWDTLHGLINDVEALEQALKAINHSGMKHIQLKNGVPTPQTQGVIGSMGAPLACLNIVSKYWRGGGGLRILKDYMSDKVKAGVLVIGTNANEQEFMQPLQTALTNMLISEGLSLGESERDVWFVLDELAALNKIPKLKNLLTLGRSFNLKCVAATQDVPQIKSVYGEMEAATLIGQFSSQFWGVLNNQESATFAANQFGNQRIERLNISENQNQGTTGLTFNPAVSTSWQRLDSSSALVDSDFLGLQKATKNGYYFWSKVTDSKGTLLAGLLKFKINPINKPYPPHIPATISINNNSSASASDNIVKDKETKEINNKDITLSNNDIDNNNNINVESKAIEYLVADYSDAEDNNNALDDNDINNETNNSNSKEDAELYENLTSEVIDHFAPGVGSAIELLDDLGGVVEGAENCTPTQTPTTTKKKKKRKLAQSQSNDMEL